MFIACMGGVDFFSTAGTVSWSFEKGVLDRIYDLYHLAINSKDPKTRKIERINKKNKENAQEHHGRMLKEQRRKENRNNNVKLSFPNRLIVGTK
jgi:hypothetical protein